jgi:hypothetical protein
MCIVLLIFETLGMPSEFVSPTSKSRYFSQVFFSLSWLTGWALLLVVDTHKCVYKIRGRWQVLAFWRALGSGLAYYSCSSL